MPVYHNPGGNLPSCMLPMYNRTPMHHLKWDTPYTLFNGEVPDISHLKVFGCSAYVHIPKETHANGLAPKSELMAYLGHTEGIKVFKFMRLLNNTMYHSTTVLFDETLFPKCSTLVMSCADIILPIISYFFFLFLFLD